MDLALENLQKRFGTTVAVQNLSLEISRGTFVAVIGPSGAGKSTLLRLINRLVAADGGRILHDGEDVLAYRGARLRDWRRRTAMIFQQFNLVDRLDVLTNVLVGRLATTPLVPALLAQFSAEEKRQAIRTLHRLDLAGHSQVRADQLSGGQQQRVAIARALLQEPQILLADEPIASLDPRSAKRVLETLRRINREDRLTVLCNLHSVEAARAYADRIVALERGRLVFDGGPEALTDARVREVYGEARSTQDPDSA